jgi:hypothetical protein
MISPLPEEPIQRYPLVNKSVGIINTIVDKSINLFHGAK